MEDFLFILRILLAAIFGVAGFAKLFDLSGSKKAVEGFGVPLVLARPIGVVLPVTEILIAVSMIFVQFSWFGAIGAAAVLAVFVIGMGWQMFKGNAPDCHCFGQVHSEPVSPKSLIRNVIFMIPAVTLITVGNNNQGLDLIDSSINSSSETPMQIIIGIATLGLLAAVVYFLKQISGQQIQIMRRIEILELTSHDGAKEVAREDAKAPAEGHPIGTIAPGFVLPDLNGKEFGLKDLLKPTRSTIFLFVSPSCNPCGALVPEIEQWQGEFKDKLDFVFISSGDAKENTEKLAGASFKQILLQKDREVAELFHAQWTPTALFVNSNGTIASRVATGDTAIRELIEKYRTESEKGEVSFIAIGNGHNLGEDVPEFTLNDATGKEISSKDLIGSRTLLTYWSNGCGYCTRMLEDLREWDKTKGADAPNLLLLSHGEPEANLALELVSPIILDDKGEISDKLGMSGTPSAVMISENGKIISEVAVGSDQIWKLVGNTPKPKD